MKLLNNLMVEISVETLAGVAYIADAGKTVAVVVADGSFDGLVAAVEADTAAVLDTVFAEEVLDGSSAEQDVEH